MSADLSAAPPHAHRGPREELEVALEPPRRFSVVVPVYFNEPNLPDTVPQLLALGERLPGYDLELVFVDDGSADRSLDVLREYQAADPERITVVKLTRNFGAMSAVQAGLSVARGDCVGVIAADLQDPPELFLDMIRHWEHGVKAVLAARVDREESPGQKAFSNAYYALIRRYALPGYPRGGFDFLLIDRQVVDHVTRIREKNTNVMSLIFWLGFEPVIIPYVRRRRTKGRSRWTLAKKLKLFVDSFVAFSYAPVRLLSTVGLMVALSSFVYGSSVLFSWLAHGIPVRGYAPIVILLAFVSGVQMMMLGVLGEYLWRVLDEVRRRPAYVVDDVYAGRPTLGPAAGAPTPAASAEAGVPAGARAGWAP